MVKRGSVRKCRAPFKRMESWTKRHTTAGPITKLDGIGSSLSVPSKDGRIKSLGDGLAQALRKYLTAKEREGLPALLSGRVKSLRPPERPAVASQERQQEALFKIKCPDCDSSGTLAFEEGCLKCHACGYSMC